MTPGILLPRLIAHRGASTIAPENTLAALGAAADAGVEAVEFDVRLTRDGACVVFHDDDLDRTSNGSGPVAECDLADLQRLDAGAWFSPAFAGEPIPTLSEVHELCSARGLTANLEIKADPGGEAAVARAVCAELVSRGEASPVTVVSSKSAECLRIVRREMPLMPIALILHNESLWRALDEARDIGCAALHVSRRRVRGLLVARVKDAGLQLGAYTVNEPARAKRLLTKGVDYLFSDVAEQLMPALAPAADSV